MEGELTQTVQKKKKCIYIFLDVHPYYFRELPGLKIVTEIILRKETFVEVKGYCGSLNFFQGEKIPVLLHWANLFPGVVEEISSNPACCKSMILKYLYHFLWNKEYRNEHKIINLTLSLNMDLVKVMG